MPNDEPIALAAYEELAEAYAAIAETKAENGYNEHPAIRKAIGPVEGLKVLDAGCGPGFLSRDLLKAGAEKLVAFDISPKMVAIARDRLGNDADIFLADMACELPDLEDGSFDLVVSSLAIDYVRDWSVPMSEFHRLLRLGGRLIFSVQHPMAAYDWYRPPSALGVHYGEAEWRGFTQRPVTVPDYYRSFEEIVMPVIGAGLALDAISETRPIDALREIDAEKYERGMTFPTFMVVEASKTPR